MPKYTLTYFAGRGLAEVSRWVFAAADQPYDDVRISHDGDRAEWLKIKPTTPFGQIPVLDIDGVKICQSNAIAHYLAHEFNLEGKTNVDHARVTMIVDCVSDVIRSVYSIRGEQDATKKAEAKKKFEDDLRTQQKYFDQFLTDNKNTGYFVGDSLTLADIAYAVGLERMLDAEIDLHLDEFPGLKQLNENVRSNPKIAAWIAKRPVTPF